MIRAFLGVADRRLHGSRTLTEIFFQFWKWNNGYRANRVKQQNEQKTLEHCLCSLLSGDFLLTPSDAFHDQRGAGANLFASMSHVSMHPADHRLWPEHALTLP